tara:strand:- start:841 stop:1416 length:576 start_codon:yes stop_codon:yes gene_type:complete
MPRKNKSRKKKGGKGFFDFLKAGESKSYTKKRCKEYENEITKLEKRIDELKLKQEEYKCLGGDMMTDNPMEQPEAEYEPEPEPEPEIAQPNQVDVDMDDEDDMEEEDDKPMKPLYPLEGDNAVEGVLDEVNAPEDRKDDNKDSIAKTITKGLTGGRRRRRKSRRKSKRKSKKRRKSRKKKSRKRRRRKSRR